MYAISIPSTKIERLTESNFRISLSLDMIDLRTRLDEHGIQSSAQRLAVAAYVLNTVDHPSADTVWKKVADSFPMISRATVYNTLHLFVKKGLLRELHLSPDSIVYDPNTGTHHHFIDDETGTIYDVPWQHIEVSNLDQLTGFRIRDYQVVMRGTRDEPPR
jgi:Fur family transcriptional regulator, iron response regulator